MKRTYQLIILFIAILGLLAAGCVGQKADVSSRMFDQDGAYLKGGMEYQTEEAYAQGSYDEKEESYGNGVQTAESRKVITTGELSLEVDDASVTVDSIINITQTAGGFVSSSSVYDSYYEDNTHKQGHVTVRIPASGFNFVIDEIGSLGRVTSKSISGTDVTEEYIDLSARLDNLELQEARLQEIMNMTETVEDVLDVEDELWRVRGEIESLTGRLNYLNNKIEFSTIHVYVTEPRPITHAWGLRDALSDSVEGFIASVNALIVFIGYALPIIIFVTVTGTVIVLIRRRTRG